MLLPKHKDLLEKQKVLKVAQEKIGAAQRLLQQIAKQAHDQGIELNRTITIGEVLSRMPDFPGAAPFDEEELEPRRQSMVGRLGAASR